MGTTLASLRFWTAPGYRSITIEAVDGEGKRYRLHVPPSEMPRLINACADATKQIGVNAPIDWEQHPERVDWPNDVTPWRDGPKRSERPT